MRAATALVGIALLLAPAVAAAEPAPASHDEPDACATSETTHEHGGLLAFRLVAGTSRAFPQNSWLFGFGTQLEVDLGGVFELAGGASVLLGEQATVVPIDLLLKKTFPIGARAGFFVGLGPTMALVHEHDELGVAFGGTANAGFVLWLDDGFGVLVEATYQLIVESDPVHDIEGAVGVAIGL